MDSGDVVAAPKGSTVSYLPQQEDPFAQLNALVAARLSQPARLGLESERNAARFDRPKNLAGEEAYLLLLRGSLIGGSSN